MQILLDIPDIEIPIERAMDTVTLVFENGHICKCNYPFKELPKGHGRLIDVDELKKIIKENDVLTMTGFSVRFCDIDNTPTIIEADREGE